GGGAGARTQQDPGLDRATAGSRLLWRGADDGGRAEQAAPADRHRHRRRHARRRAEKRPGGGAWFLRRSEGHRMMTQITDLGVTAIRDGFRAGDFSAREVAEAFIGAVEKARPLNAFIVETPDHA